MIPPVPPEVFANNPQFKELYTQLVTEVLNPHDGSTRDADRPESAASLEQVGIVLEILSSRAIGIAIPLFSNIGRCKCRN